MKYGLWKHMDQGVSLTFTGFDAYEEYVRQGAIEPDAELIWTVEAESWNEACTRYHEFMGYEPYKPMDEQPELLSLVDEHSSTKPDTVLPD